VRAEADGSGPKLTGHFSPFNEWTEINSAFEGHFMERFVPGAFAKTISQDRERMRVLFNHGHDFLGEQQLGSIDVLKEDERGGYYEVGLNAGIPELLMDGLRKGQYGSSHRFIVERAEQDTSPKRSDYNPDRIPERSVIEATVREFGPVTFPQYKGATAQARSGTDELLFDWIRAEPELVRSFLNLRKSVPAMERRELRRFKNKEEFVRWISSR
jgi:hypothetical protein